MRAPLLFLLPPLLASCSSTVGKGDVPEKLVDSGSTPSPILGVPATAETSVAGLTCPVHIVRTEANVPHVYARDRSDLSFAAGFVFAQDRYFMLDLARRLGLGEVSELLGDAALSTDIDARATGMTHVAETLLANMTPGQADHLDAYAAGVNAYIAEVEAGRLPPPSELEVAAGVLGASNPVELMKPFDRRDLAGVLAPLVYELGFETDDVGGEALAARALAGIYPDETEAHDLREAAALNQVYPNIGPIYPIASAPDWSLSAPSAPVPPPAAGRVPAAVISRLEARMVALERRLHRDSEVGFGSNSWAVMGAEAADGRALVAGDGHLPLTVPSLFWQLGLDTSEFGGGNTHQLGLFLPGLPYMAVGTNGEVAWSQTQLGGDITDWYSEVITLDEAGLPAASLVSGGTAALVAIPEVLDVAEVPALGSIGRTVTFTRWTTADGRFLVEIEGEVVSEDTVAPEGSMVVRMGDTFVIPGDMDGDGQIAGVSFDYTGLDPSGMLGALDSWGHASSVAEIADAARGLVAYSQNIVAADVAGSVLYTSFQAVPCRGYLPRGEDGAWLPGADPTRLIDGTQYPGFSVVLDETNRVDTSFEESDTRCMIPAEEIPFAIDPAQGWVATANNDPGGQSFDLDLANNGRYIGGPWDVGTRIERIAQRLDEVRGAADVAAMADIQADHRSNHGHLLAPSLVASLRRAAALAEDPGEDPANLRIAALYTANAVRFEEVENRLATWVDRGTIAESGVETFYHSPSAEQVEDSVATMIFNVWKGWLNWYAIEDEGVSALFPAGGNHGRLSLLVLLFEGLEDPSVFAERHPETGEPVFWDLLGTAEIERADEVVLMALVAALDQLEGAPSEDGQGGFGTTDMSQWRWGLRHMARFESILGEFLGDDPTFSVFTEMFAITPDRLPLEGLDVPWFPRPGDTESVDAANSGFNRDGFTYGSGPVFRMVWALGPDGVEGLNVLPGGQSALTDSAFFDDQAALWLGNEAIPMRFDVTSVVAGATGREVLLPADGADCGMLSAQSPAR